MCCLLAIYQAFGLVWFTEYRDNYISIISWTIYLLNLAVVSVSAFDVLDAAVKFTNC